MDSDNDEIIDMINKAKVNPHIGGRRKKTSKRKSKGSKKRVQKKRTSKRSKKGSKKMKRTTDMSGGKRSKKTKKSEKPKVSKKSKKSKKSKRGMKREMNPIFKLWIELVAHIRKELNVKGGPVTAVTKLASKYKNESEKQNPSANKETIIKKAKELFNKDVKDGTAMKKLEVFQKK